MQWKELYDKAAEKLAPRAVSPFIEAGGVAAAILTAAGNVYTGVCIDTACTLGMCAERSAIANMITNGESRIVRLSPFVIILAMALRSAHMPSVQAVSMHTPV